MNAACLIYELGKGAGMKYSSKGSVKQPLIGTYMTKVSKYFGICFVLFFSMFILSCNPTSTYLNKTEFERMRNKCISVLPDSYSFKLCVPFVNCSLCINVKNGESTTDYYFYTYDTPTTRNDLADWIKDQVGTKFNNSNAILLDVKSINDVFSYIEALYDDQLNDFNNFHSGRYFSTQIKYDKEYFFPISFSCDIRKSSIGINVPPSAIEPISATIENFYVGN